MCLSLSKPLFRVNLLNKNSANERGNRYLNLSPFAQFFLLFAVFICTFFFGREMENQNVPRFGRDGPNKKLSSSACVFNTSNIELHEIATSICKRPMS